MLSPHPLTNARYAVMPKTLSDAARKALASTDWTRVDAMTDADLARQIAANTDAAPNMRSTSARSAAWAP